MRFYTYCSLIFIVFLISCQSDINPTKTDTLFSRISSATTNINFVNTVENGKDVNIFTYRNFYNGGGVAIGDINNDELPDIYFTANLGANKLYVNKGNFEFEDISESAGVQGKNVWSTGVVMVDINSDGLLDIYVCNAGNVKGDNLKNELFINNGDNTFTEQAEAYNLAGSGLTTHAAFFDYDQDGDLDVYILNNSFIPVSSLNYSNKRELRDKDWDVPNLLKGGGDKLLRNDNGKFTDVSETSGIYGSLIGFGLGVTVGDINADGFPDIYVSNDFYERDYLYINNQDGTFSESIQDWTGHISQSSMGADMADINNDGAPDIFVTDMLPEPDQRLKETTHFENYDLYQRKQKLDFYHQYMQNTLQLNNQNNQFSEIANFSGISKTDWSWGALLFDMDNDGYKDIFVCNGINHDLTNQDFMNFFANDIIQQMVISGKKQEVDEIVNKMPSVPIKNYAFQNNQNLGFKNKTSDWGFDLPTFSNGAAYADLDNDGDLDLVINNVNQEALVYRNNTEKKKDHNFIKIKLVGDDANHFAIGSKIKLNTDDGIIFQEVIPSRGFQSSTDYVQTIGIGTKHIQSIEVIWPDNTVQTISDININSTLEIKKSNEAVAVQSKSAKNTLLKKQSKTFKKHTENPHSDFDYEGLIQFMLSQEGPTISVADINKDGLHDVFIGGAKGNEAILYIQDKQGRMTPGNSTAFGNFKHLEDTASAIFDVDNDGDLDIIVGTGGNEVRDEKKYQTRIYINNGNGTFNETKTVSATFHNTSVIAPYDFDNDGDIDVFVGSRSVPAVYGINPTHQLLENDGRGNFKDITSGKAFAFGELGMVTDALWFDADEDGKKDLLVVGDWMAPTLFRNNGRRLSKLETSLDDLSGWWNVCELMDVNGDGKEDLILGNRGSNIGTKPSLEKPMKLYVNDFDNNGTIEQIVTQNLNGKDVPVIMKHELTAQIVSLKKQNSKFSEFAKKSIDQLFSKEVLEQSIVRQVITSKSVIAINKGNQQFEIKALPQQVQFSSVNAILPMDVNNDGIQDLLLGGNQYEFKPQYARLDANYGSTLISDGKGNFSWLNNQDSGFFIKGEVKEIVPVKTLKGTGILVGINNEQPEFFEIVNE